MKMKPEHYQVIKEEINKLDRTAIFNTAQAFSENPKIKDKAKALRWACLHATKLKLGDGVGLSGLPVYSYCNDSHIDTALKQVMKDLHILC